MKNYEVKVTVTNKSGIHARPSALIARAVDTALADKDLSVGKIFMAKADSPETAIDPSGIINILSLACRWGERLIISTNDERYNFVVDRLVEVITNMKDF